MLLALSLRSSLTETEPPFVGAERVVLSFLFLISPARGPRRRYAVYTRRTRAAPVSARTVAREQFFSPHNFISCATTCRGQAVQHVLLQSELTSASSVRNILPL